MTDKAMTTATAPAKQDKPEAVVERPRRPFERFRALEAEMDRLMDEMWPFGLRPFQITRPSRRWNREGAVWMPRMDVYRNDGNLVIKAELPGLKPEDVSVTVEEGDLIIRGQRQVDQEVHEADYYRAERTYGEFYRRQPLPDGTRPEQITASFKDGVLEVMAPMPPGAKPETRPIPITTK